MQVVQRANPSIKPLGQSALGKSKLGQASWVKLGQPATVHPGDQVHFGKLANITGPIPPHSLVILVPGMFSLAQNLRTLAQYLKSNGHTVYTLESPFNIKADSALASTDWLTHGIDRIRLDESSAHYVKLLQKLQEIPQEGRVNFLCTELNLKTDDLGKATAQAALGLIFTPESGYCQETDFTRIILRLRKRRENMEKALPAETARKQLFSLTAIARKQLRRELLPFFLKPSTHVMTQDIALEKTIDHVVDQIAPRVVLVGHSMGGFVSMLTLFEQMNDTALVVGLSAPGENGTDLIPPALGIFKRLSQTFQQKGREFAERFGPGIAHMVSGSAETAKLQADHQPFNTTIFAVGLPGDMDGLIGEKNFRMNDALPGRVNVVVTPRQANIIEIASQNLFRLHQLLTWTPLYSQLANFVCQSSEFVKGISYHCGLLQFQDQYWPQQGDMLRGIFEAPKNEQGNYDYQSGVPDYQEAVKQIRRVIAPNNYEAERQHFLTLLQDHLIDAKAEKTGKEYLPMQQAYRQLLPDLQAISQEQQPVQGGVAEKAKALLAILSAPDQPRHKL